MAIKLNVGVSNVNVSLKNETKDEKISLRTGTYQRVVTSNYRDLTNLPTINGGYPEYKQTLVENYDEVDPTVPDWAKEENKPEYTAEEVGAVDVDNELTYAEMQSVWNMFFSN